MFLLRNASIILISSISLFGLNQAMFTESSRKNTICSVQPGKKSLKETIKYTIKGVASYYGFGDGFHGRSTASGEIFDAHGLTAAHRTLSFGTKVLVKNPDNGKEVLVTINDRGPYHGNREIDLSYAAAQKIGIVKNGIKKVLINVVG